MEDDVLPPPAQKLVDGVPDIPLDSPRDRRTCVIEDFWKEGRRYIGLRVAVDESYREAYRVPGQYVTLSPEHLDPRFLVIANAPGPVSATEWEFLVDRQTNLGGSIEPLSPGSTLAISAPEGPGWPLDEAAGRPVVCFVTGSGIASIRPLLQHWKHHVDLAPSQTTLYYGESRARDFAYTDETAEWNNHGVRTFHCNGATGETEEDFQYVQHAFEADVPELDDAFVLLAGAPVMKRAVLERLLDQNFPIDRVFTNI
ncbi:MAG: hypothetical protein ABEN55_01360 [Bradymonadaceae bacterium]